MPSLLDLVGNTPLLDISHLVNRPGVQLLAKCEGNNPASSVKDRAAKGMIAGALARGELRRGMRLVEATSGNTGIALAMIAQAVGIEMHLVMPDTLTIERTQTMRAFGAVVHLIDGGMEAARDKALAMVAQTRGQPDAFLMLNQFDNPDNALAHYQSTGPEIWRDTAGAVTHFVSAMGTTGTIMGTSRYLKERNPAVQILGCQPTEGSSIPGIRRWPAEYMPKIFERSRVDGVIDVTARDAEATARMLARTAGLFTGPSAGGACWGALQLAATLEKGCLVFIACDRGDRYLSSDLFRV
ncbi:MAG TPA: cysteine synthase CysM [Planctomycetes bacterium]|nr:cysteine synthase CysM [Planctomycetota bacterium]